MTELQRRLVDAWSRSGMRLGKLIVYAANRYAMGTAVSLPGLTDEAVVEMVERYADTYCEGPEQDP